MVKYVYSNKVAAKRDLQLLTINSLMGVDYSSSMVNIRDYHAYDIKNFLKKNNVLRNRNGYEQVGKHKINGIWECNYKGEKRVIAHIGNSIYEVNDIDKYDVLANNYTVIDTLEGIKDDYSWGIFTNDRLYILCGKYYVIKFDYKEKVDGVEVTYRYKITEVYNDEDTYIPTTTIGITYDGSSSGIKRQSLDNINMLSSYRYNSISSLVGANETAGYNDYTGIGGNRYYLLDGKLNYESDLSEIELSIEFVDSNGTPRTIKDLKPNAYAEGGLTYNIDKSLLGSATFPEFQQDTITIGKVYRDSKGTWLHLTYDFLPPYEGNDNVLVKYKIENTDYELINGCTFGIMYGANGNRNRLFISGNPDYPNVDYHTSRRNVYASDKDKDLQDSQDLTYFSVYDYCAYGTTNSRVTDYQIMGNGDLMVLKEHNNNEPNIYFRNGTFTIDENGYTIESYSMRTGNIGQGTNKKTCGSLCNLNNDLVFVSHNGVYGISSTISAGVLNSDYQYAYSRSSLINSKLNEYFSDSEAITAIISDNRYILTLKGKNGSYKTFVADGRYPYKLPENIDNEYEYEWFVFDNIKADKYYIVNDVLYFTNEHGLYKLDLNKDVKEHVDIDRYSVLSGELLLSSGKKENVGGTNDDISVGSDISAGQGVLDFINETSVLTIKNSNVDNELDDIFAKCEITINSDGLCENNDIHNDIIRAYFEDAANNEIYLYYNGNKRQIYPKEEENEYNIYGFYDDTYINKYHFSEGKYTILFKINNKKFTFSYYIDSNTNEKVVEQLIDIYGCELVATDINLNDTVPIIGVIENKTVVDCLYVTKAFNMDQSLYNKNLKSITVINDAESYSWVNFAIRTKKVKKRFDENIVGGTDGLTDTYQNIFKADLTDSSFATSFTKNYFLKFNFIQFEFYNNNGSDCIINNINVVYTIGFKQGGVS